MKNLKRFEHLDGSEIAVIGLAGRFPGAKDIASFWANLRDGVESITFFTDDQLQAAGINPLLLQKPNYVKAKPILKDIEMFDAPFFGFNPAEAEVLDPQHRLFLECVWNAIEDAGYDAETYRGAISIFAGTSLSTYLLNNLYANPQAMAAAGSFLSFLSNSHDSLTTRIAYKLNLKGACYTLQTFCSTSLVAVHVACQSLLNFECDMAVGGGVSIYVPQIAGYWFEEGGIKSPDGHCRPFDTKAHGTLFGNGLGAVVLKRLEDALADGDHIEAIIKGSAINNDGSLKVSYSAPSVSGQAEVIVEALSNADVPPETVTYVETHGTGTSLGDPAEVAALTRAFRSGTQKNGFCAIGSLKSNIGHLDAAAGVASLIKAILALKHRAIPPSLHFEAPNPEIDFANSPFYVNARLSEWKTDGLPRRAGVSSFGIGGTNAHLILQEAPELEPSGGSRPHQLLLLSAKTDSALEAATQNLIDYLKKYPDVNLADVAYTLQAGRKAFSHRRMLVCQDVNDAIMALEAAHPKRVFTLYQEKRNPPIAFMFPGQGVQYANMALELYQSEPTFRQHVDAGAELFRPQLGLDLRQALFPREEQIEAATQKLTQTAVAQPALFVIEYALAKLLISWGIKPHAMLGHSIGEYVAACLAEVLSFQDAVSLVASRASLMHELTGGMMLAIPLASQDLEPLLRSHDLASDVSIAAINSPSLCVVSGSTEAIQRLEAQLTGRGLECRRLHTSHAFHSSMMDPVLAPFSERLSRVGLNPPVLPYISNLTGTWITAAQATDPAYWTRHLRQTVRFSDGVSDLLEEPNRILLELGPGQTLSSLVKQHTSKVSEPLVVSSLRHAQERRSDLGLLLSTVGRLWLAGVDINWAAFYSSERRHRLSLPTYPFERQRYWIEPSKQIQTATAVQRASTKKPNVNDWFYSPSWKRCPCPVSWSESPSQERLFWLMFLDECGFGSKLAARLRAAGQHVATVRAGSGFEQIDESSFRINASAPGDYHDLCKKLKAAGKSPNRIVHLWSLTEPRSVGGKDLFETCQTCGFTSLLYLVQSIGEWLEREPIQIKVISNHVQEVIGDEMLIPEKATLLGPCRVMSQEYPHIRCASIDLVLPEVDTPRERDLLNQLEAELKANAVAPTVAYRGSHRWVQDFEAIHLHNTPDRRSRLKHQGVYLITGGLGGIGLVLAEHLARSVQARLVLIARTELPPKDQWQHWLESHDELDAVSSRIRKLQALEFVGAEVLVIKANVADASQMDAALAEACQRYGEINGVIHAAGIAGGGIMQLRSVEAAAEVMSAKVQGTLVLGRLLGNANLDFFVLCSSTTSFLGGVGQVDYCAANAFLDVYAQQHRLTNQVFAVNWCAWQEVGMAVNTAVPDDLKAEREQNLKLGILPREGAEAFSRILSGSFPQVLVSTQDFPALMEMYSQAAASPSEEKSLKAALAKPMHARPALATAYIASENPTEQALVEIWQRLLGIEKIGTRDNFFELGGHSLLATQVLSRLRGVFQVELPLRTLFEATTVADLAKRIQTIQWLAESQKAGPAALSGEREEIEL